MDFPKSVPGVGLVNNLFVDEDPVGGTPGSLIPAAWGNQVTNELLNAIRAAGLQPSEEQENQLLKAVRVLRGGSANLGFWQWSDAAGAPGAKRIAMNNATPASVTKLFLAEVSAEELDYSQTFGLLRSGDTVCIQQRDGLDFSLRFRVLGDLEAGAGYRELPVEYVSGSGALPAVDAVVTVLFTPAGASDSGMPVGSVMWWPSRDNIPAGYGPGDGQLVSRATFPDATNLAINSHVPVTADATWLADPTKRGMWTLGDGASTIRLPDYNGKAAGSLGALFMRGDGALSAGQAGSIQLDALQNITGESSTFPTGGTSPTSGTGAFTTNGRGGVPTGIAGGGGWGTASVSFDASRVARTATETRSLNVTGCWVIKMHGAAANAGAVDAVQLASDYLALLTRVIALEGSDYVSPPQSYVAGGALTLAHGLGVVPKDVSAELVCITAEAGYSAGDIVQVSASLEIGSSVHYGVNVRKTASELVARIGANGMIVGTAAGGVATQATPANWRLILRAFA